jgi:ubiquinone/menaquinone biosynthesis C-methylase UbiE
MTLGTHQYYFSPLEDEATKLRVEVQRPYSEQFLTGLGLRNGLRVADIGCGSGHVSCWIATQVAPDGYVAGYDINGPAIAAAKEEARYHQLNNVEFGEASVYALPRHEPKFDLVYSRLLVDDLADKEHALRLMCERVKPGGILACEVMDMCSSYCHPRSAAFDRLVEFYLTFAKEYRGKEQDFARNMFMHFQDIGLESVQVGIVQPVFYGPRLKRYLAFMVEEFVPAAIQMNLTTQEEGEHLATEIRALVQDERCIMAGGRIFQVAGQLPQ